MTSKLLAETLAKQNDLEQIDPDDLGSESDARPFITGTPRRTPDDFEQLSRCVAQLGDLRLSLAIQRGAVRSEFANDPVPHATGFYDYSIGSHARSVIPVIRADIAKTIATIEKLAASLTARGHKFGHAALGIALRSAPISGNAESDSWDDAA